MAKKKAPNGMGSITEIKAQKRWRWRMMTGRNPKTGKAEYVYRYAKTRAEVVKMRDEYLAEQRQGLRVNKNPTFQDCANSWFEEHKAGGFISPTTACGYEYTLRGLNQYFGKRKIKDILTPEIDKYLHELRQEKSESSVTKHKAMLHQVFDYAIGYKLILNNPVDVAKKKYPVLNKEDDKQKKKEKDSFTREEAAMLMLGLDETDLFQAGVKLMLGTGMRMQELLALKREDIAEDGSCIRIRQAVNLEKGKVNVGDTKNDPSKRDIPVPEVFRQCALRLRREKGEYIYALRDSDKPCNPTHFRKKYYRCVENIGVRKLAPHCLRHTYVTHMQAAGVPVQTIQKCTGHTKIRTTELYLHVQPHVTKNAAAQYGEYLTAAIG